MPTSPEAASVVERLRYYTEPRMTMVWLSQSDAKTLLAVVEAAKAHRAEWPSTPGRTGKKLDALLDALYTPDSAEAR